MTTKIQGAKSARPSSWTGRKRARSEGHNLRDVEWTDTLSAQRPWPCFWLCPLSFSSSSPSTISKRRAAGKDLGGRQARFTDSQIQNARRLINADESAAQVAKDLSMSRATLYRRMSELDA
ncbi:MULTISPECIES: helix-turn-helix domain-containing protein [Cryobacterium]|uniref:helix-turn-helix domain-containing protein n=1 Tax=Cryobacterium TaxID=69578 RepID=UPI0030CAB35D